MKGQIDWPEYYQKFSYFSADAIRDGCAPAILRHNGGSSKAIVLVHGLTDSPYFMQAIGRHFYEHLGYDVYLPLLQCHGLKQPDGMESVALAEWKENVSFAVDSAAENANTVSIGGLSTGGTLSFYNACKNPKVTGQLYLFSAALDIAGGPAGLVGEFIERASRTFLTDVLDRFDDQTLIGENPYRYSRMDKDGVRELAMLIAETDKLLAGYKQHNPFTMRVFAAHSYADKSASIDGIKRLQNICVPGNFSEYYIDKEKGVDHASVVLASPVKSSDGKTLENANPDFEDMMQQVSAFESSPALFA